MWLSLVATYPAFRGSLSSASWTALPKASSFIPSSSFITSWGCVGTSCGRGLAQLRADRLEWGAPRFQMATMATLLFTTWTNAMVAVPLLPLLVVILEA